MQQSNNSNIYRCLSIRQPWVDAIFSSGKDVENRTWSTAYRGLLLIHSSAYVSKKELSVSWDFIESLGIIPNPGLLTCGAILGAVDLVGCDYHCDSDDYWGLAEHYWWRLENPRKLVSPIPYKGQLGLYPVELDKALEFVK